MLKFDFTQIEGFSHLMENYPSELANALVVAFDRFSEATNKDIRADVQAGLKSKNKGLAKSFKTKVADKSHVKGNIDKVFANFSSRWKPAKIFQTGGTIKAYSGTMMVLTQAAKYASGKIKYKPEQLRAMIASGEAKIITTSRGPMIALYKDKKTKTGKYRKGARMEILAWLRKQITEPKRLHFYETFDGKSELMMDLLDVAVEDAFIAAERKKGKGE